MSKELDEIRRKFHHQFGNTVDVVFQAVVKDVDETEFTCTVQRDEQVNYFDVRLRGLVNADLQGFAFIPKLESLVLVCRIGQSNELFVCQFTEIDKMIFTASNLEIFVDNDNVDLTKGDVKIHIDSGDISIDAKKVIFNGGTNGSMVKIKELEKNLDSIKSYIESMNTALPNAFSAIGAAMSAVGANGATAYQTSMSGKIIDITSMADDKITH